MSKETDAKRKSQLGQFFTPAKTARFMASLFPPASGGACRLIDPGAGIGSLSGAFLERCVSGSLAFDSIELSAFEIDEQLHPRLSETLEAFRVGLGLSHEIVGGDFIEEAVNRMQLSYGGSFTHAILNPPYRKIATDSRHRRLLRQGGIEAVNLYSAFVALSLALLAPGGQLVAIVPRSFCNGPYYRHFRNSILDSSAIRRIHLFHSRNAAFRDDDVLQENVILLLERGGRQGDVSISTSTDDTFDDLAVSVHPFGRIVLQDDPERFIHVPISLEPNPIENSVAIRHTLEDIGLQVSTGPVVDFRLKGHLRQMPNEATVPLLYPVHFSSEGMAWPRPEGRKPNAILRNGETERWLYPKGFYCVVRRFSSKEEKRRIVAGVVDPRALAGAQAIGFENHLNVFHEGKRGLPEALARGLAAYLNATAVDEIFRRFNGHTQVNATDLRRMKYPSREALIALGEWMMRQKAGIIAPLDEHIEKLVA